MINKNRGEWKLLLIFKFVENKDKEDLSYNNFLIARID